MSDWLLVMPTIRRPNWDYLEPVLGRVDVAILDDTDGDIPKVGNPRGVSVYDYSDCEHVMGREVENALIARKSPSRKSVGFYLAWEAGYKGVIALDDDVDLRVTPDYLDRIPVGRKVSANVASSSGGWANPTGDMRDNYDVTLVSRGVPYECRPIPVDQYGDAEWLSPVFNQGMWCGTPDINGIDKIQLGIEDCDDVVTDPTRRIDGYFHVPPGNKLPCSIMNCQFSRDLIPAFYQPPDYPLASGWTIRRHDDVWSCRFAKVCADLKGDVFTYGEPIGLHTKEGDPRKEAVAENVTNLIQYHFDRCLDAAAESARLSYHRAASFTYATLAMLVASKFRHEVNGSNRGVPPQFAAVLSDYADRCHRWAELFAEG